MSSVLNSERAVQVNIDIVRAFVRLREMIASNKDLAKHLDELEKKYDKQFKVVLDAIRELMTPPVAPRRRIGFHREEPRQPVFTANSDLLQSASLPSVSPT